MDNAADSPADTTLWAQFVRVSQAVLAAVERDLKAAGFPPLAWYDALLELRRAEPDGLRPVALQQQMLLAQYNISRLIDRLDAAGLVRRQPCPQDRRGQVLHLTEKGRALIDAMWPAYRDAIAAHFSGLLGPDDAAALAAILEKLRPASPQGN